MLDSDYEPGGREFDERRRRRREGRRRAAATVPSEARDLRPKAANSLDGRARDQAYAMRGPFVFSSGSSILTARLIRITVHTELDYHFSLPFLGN